MPGTRVLLSFKVEGGGSQLKAGMNVFTPTGRLSTSSDTSVKTSTNGATGLPEITHSTTKSMDSSAVATFSFFWTAPSTFSSAVLTGWGNAVNGRDGDNGDQAASSTFTIAVCPDADGDGARDATCGGTDCNDANGTVKPGAFETCNGIDDDCDGVADDGAGALYYSDDDGDGYGSSPSMRSCSQPEGYVTLSGDCDDTDPEVNPSIEETCDDLDNDCDGQIDDGVQLVWYRDQDADGYGTTASTTSACAPPIGYVDNTTDCDDADETIHPEALELATECEDGIDQDCNDQDLSCEVSDQDADGQAPIEGDCDDLDPTVYDGALESCDDGIDQDCGGSDLDCDDVDVDLDGQTPAQGDCDDTNPAIFSGALEPAVACDDGIDQDCSGQDLSCAVADLDGDGVSALAGDCDDHDPLIRPGSEDVCEDGIDQNCDTFDAVCLPSGDDDTPDDTPTEAPTDAPTDTPTDTPHEDTPTGAPTSTSADETPIDASPTGSPEIDTPTPPNGGDPSGDDASDGEGDDAEGDDAEGDDAEDSGGCACDHSRSTTGSHGQIMSLMMLAGGIGACRRRACTSA